MMMNGSAFAPLVIPNGGLTACKNRVKQGNKCGERLVATASLHHQTNKNNHKQNIQAMKKILVFAAILFLINTVAFTDVATLTQMPNEQTMASLQTVLYSLQTAVSHI